MQNLAQILSPLEYKEFGWCKHYNRVGKSTFKRIIQHIKYKVHLYNFRQALKEYSFRMNENFSCSRIVNNINSFNLKILKKDYSYKITESMRTLFIEPVRVIIIDSNGNFRYVNMKYTAYSTLGASFFSLEYKIPQKEPCNNTHYAQSTSLDIFHELESMYLIGMHDVN